MIFKKDKTPKPHPERVEAFLAEQPNLTHEQATQAALTVEAHSKQFEYTAYTYYMMFASSMMILLGAAAGHKSNTGLIDPLHGYAAIGMIAIIFVCAVAARHYRRIENKHFALSGPAFDKEKHAA